MDKIELEIREQWFETHVATLTMDYSLFVQVRSRW